MVSVDAREQPVVGTRAPAMLALLAINVNQRVSVDALMEAAWGDQVSAGAASTLASHIWRLRQVLEPGRDRHQSPAVLVSDSDGYRLVGGPSTVDSLRFAEAAAEVRDLLAAGHAESAVRRADSALALWRGQPYGGLADADWARSAVSRLEELRGQMQERRIEGLLASGAVDAALSDVQPLIAAMPFREPLRALQMEALYRGGRAEEALNAYQDARRTLLDEVGIEPGPELQSMHQRVLLNDPGLDRRVERVVVVRREVEVHLPPVRTPLVGRGDVVERLSEIVRGRRLVTVTGAAGCGKTRVAVETARAVVQDFPDGVWFVDLTAVTDLDLVIDVVVSTIGFAASPGATPLQDLGRYLHSRRVLLLLDNCEHVLPSVEQIIRVTLDDPAGAPECSFLTTSREPIGIDGEIIWALGPLGLPAAEDGPGGEATSPAVELFLQRLAAVAPAMVVDDDVRARAAEISVAVDGLPLPLELAAARAFSHSLQDIAAQVAVDPGRLSRIGRGAQDHRATVRSAIDWSHRLLSPAEQRTHRRLAVLPGAFTAASAAAVIGEDGGPEDVDDLLARLVHRSLLSSEGSPQRGRPTAFRQLATVRSHARHALEDAGEMRICLDRRDAWSAGLLADRPSLGVVTEVEWDRRIDDNYATIRATLTRRLIDEPSPEGGRLAHPLTYYWYYRDRLVEGSRWLQLGHEALRDALREGVGGAEPTDELLARLALAATLTLRRRLDLVHPLLEGIEAQVRRAPADRLLEVGEALVGLSVTAYTSEAYQILVQLNPVLTWVVEEVSDPHLVLVAEAVRCCVLLVTGRLEAAVELARSVQGRAEAGQHLAAGFISTAPLVIGALKANRPEEGLPWIDRCAALQLRLGSGAIGMFTETKANFVAQLGDYPRAAQMYAAARVATRRAAMVWPNRELTHPLLAATREHLSRTDYERAWQQGEGMTATDVFGL